MPNAETSKLKKIIEKKKHLQVDNILKESIRATIITKVSWT